MLRQNILKKIAFITSGLFLVLFTTIDLRSEQNPGFRISQGTAYLSGGEEESTPLNSATPCREASFWTIRMKGTIHK